MYHWADLGDEYVLGLDISVKAVVLVAEVHSLKYTHLLFLQRKKGLN